MNRLLLLSVKITKRMAALTEQENVAKASPMDQISIKTPNPKCRLYCCLIESIDWRYSQSCIFDPSYELAPR